MITAALGWLGMAGTFLAYLLLWRGRVGSESMSYALLNTAGGLLGGAASAMYGAWPSVASNVVWAVVGAQSVAAAWARRGDVAATSPWGLLDVSVTSTTASDGLAHDRPDSHAEPVTTAA